MSAILRLAIMGAAIGLAVYIGNRLSTDAMAVVIGVMFGVAASIPSSLLILAASRRAARREASEHRQAPQPRVIIVGGAVQQPQPALPAPAPASIWTPIDLAPAQDDRFSLSE